MIRFFVLATYSKASIAWTQNVVAPQTDRRRIGRVSQTSGSSILYLRRSWPKCQRGAVALRIRSRSQSNSSGKGCRYFSACSPCIIGLAAFSIRLDHDFSDRNANRTREHDCGPHSCTGRLVVELGDIVYTIDEIGLTPRFGFAYGTLPAHAEHGEEQFLVEMDAQQNVWYSIRSFSRPRLWAARLAYPVVRLLQRRFVRDSFAAIAGTRSTV